MRVTCDQCGARYELDEAKVPETGIAVKCAECQSLFVARRPKRAPEPIAPVPIEALTKPAAPPPKQPEPTPNWVLRRTDGHSFPFKEISTIQRWVVERKAIREDEISSDGVTWRKLSTVPELGPFFDVVDKASRGAFASQTPPDQAPTAPTSTPRMTMQMWAAPDPDDAGVEQAPPPHATKPELAVESAPKPAPEPKPDPEPEPTPTPTPEPEPDPEPESEPTPEPEPTPETVSRPSVIVDLGQSSIPAGYDEKRTATPPPGGIAAAEIEDTPILAEAPPEPVKAPESPKETPDAPETVPVVASRDEQKELGEPLPVEHDDWSEGERAPSPAAAPSSQPAKGRATSEWDGWSDDEADFGSRSKKVKIIGIVAVALVALLGVLYFVAPGLLGLGGKAIPESALASLAQARTLLNTQSPASFDQADAILTGLVAAHPEWPQAKAALAEAATARADLILYTLSDLTAQQAEMERRVNALRKDLEEVKGKDEAKMTELAALAETLNPLNQRLQDLTGQLNSAMDRAREQTFAAHALAPEDPLCQRALADYYRLGDKPGDAMDHLDLALAKLPDDPLALYIKGALFAIDKAAYPQAVEQLTQALNRDPSMVQARFKLAHVHLLNGERDAALLRLKEIVDSHNPQHAEARALLETLASAPAAETAEVAAEPEATPGAPTETTAKAEVPKTEPPKAAATQAEPPKPASFDNLMNEARRHQRADRTAAALKVYQQALALKATDEALAGVAYCYVDLGKPAEAKSHFERALASNPRHAGAIYGMALVAEMQGDAARAKIYYTRYLEQHPNGPEAGIVRRKIENAE